MSRTLTTESERSNAQTSSRAGSRISTRSTSRTISNDDEISSNTAVSKTASSTRSLHSEREYRRALRRILTGSLEDLPPTPPDQVRLYISATESDWMCERSRLAQEAFHKLRSFCNETLKMDFRVIDMRWAETDDITNDHVVETLCQEAVTDSRYHSFGPYFLTLMGDVYGERHLPAVVEARDFEALFTEARLIKHPKTDLLEDWYLRDDNAKPPVYVLQPIKSILEYFGDHFNQDNEESRKKDEADWLKASEAMKDVFRQAAASLGEKGRLSESKARFYATSVQEQEIGQGLFGATNPSLTSLCFMRLFKNLGADNLTEQAAAQHTDTVIRTGMKVELDTDKAALRHNLQRVAIPSRLHKDNIIQYHMPWCPGGIDPNANPRHAEYLENLDKDVQNGVQRLLEEAILDLDTVQLQSTKYNSSLPEILAHLRYCLDIVANFRGQEKTLETVRVLLEDAHYSKPIVVYGEPGTGKTALIAFLVALVPEWFGRESGAVVRFVGITSESSDLYDVLFSVITQLSDLYRVPLEPLGYRNITTLRNYFPKFLRSIGRACKHHVYVFIDSLDQLGITAHALEWLPTVLPSNVHLVVSLRTGDVLDIARGFLDEQTTFVELDRLSDTDAHSMMEAYLSFRHRSVTKPQWELVMKLFRRTGNALHLRLILDQAIAWTSHVAANTIKLPPTAVEIVHKTFADLEARLGRTLVSRALGYLTIGLGGLTELELEDALTLDDQLLDEVYVFKDPPVEGQVRFPTLLWTRLRRHIRVYLTERRSNGKNTLYWTHPISAEVALKRYATGKIGEELHRHLAELFATESGVSRDVCLSRRSGLIANRQVTPQPMQASNRRKLNCLPYHLLHSGDTDRLKTLALCNIKYMMAKAEGCYLDGLISDYDLVLNHIKDGDEELSILRECLLEMKPSLKTAELIPAELLARIPAEDPVDTPGESQTHLATLLEQCKQCLQSSPRHTLIPLYPALADRHYLHATFKNCSRLLSTSHDCDELLVKGIKDDGSDRKVYYQLASLREGKLVYLPGKCQSHLVTPVVSSGGKFAFTLALWDGGPVENRKGILSERSALYAKSTKWRTTNCSIEDTMRKLERYHLVCRKLSAVTMETIKEYRLKIPGFDSDRVMCMQVSSDLSTLALVYASQINTEVVVWDLLENKLISQYEISSDSQNDVMELVLVPRMNTVICLVEPLDGQKEAFLHFYYRKPKISRTTLIPGKPLPVRTVLTDDNTTVLVAFCRPGGQLCVGRVDILTGVSRVVVVGEAPGPQPTPLLCLTRGELPHSCTVSSTHLEVYLIANHNRTLVQPHTVRAPTAVAMDDALEMIAMGDENGYLHLWRYDPPSYLGCHQVSNSELLHIFFAGDWQSVFTWTGDEQVQIWSVQSLLHVIKDQNGHNPSSWSFISKHNSEDASRGNFDLSHHRSAVQVQFVSQGQCLLTCDVDARVRYWDVRTLAMMKEVKLPVEMAADDLRVVGNDTLLALCTKTHRFCMFNDKSRKSLTFTDCPSLRQLAMTSSADGRVVYLLTRVGDKAHVYEISTSGFNIRRKFTLKEPLPTDNVEIYLTEDERHLAVQQTCTVKERELIKLAEERTNMVISTGPHKYGSVDLQGKAGVMVICNRPLTSIPCLGNCWTRLSGSKFLIGRETKVMVWDAATGDCQLEVIEGTRIPKFYRPVKVDQKEMPSVCYGRTLCIATSSGVDAHNNQCSLVVIGSEDGWCVPFNAKSGSCLDINLSTKQSHSSAVEHVCLSPSNQLLASVSSNNTLKVFDLMDKGREIFNMKLNLQVATLTFSPDGAHVLVHGRRPQGDTKVILFNITGG